MSVQLFYARRTDDAVMPDDVELLQGRLIIYIYIPFPHIQAHLYVIINHVFLTKENELLHVFAKDERKKSRGTSHSICFD